MNTDTYALLPFPVELVEPFARLRDSVVAGHVTIAELFNDAREASGTISVPNQGSWTSKMVSEVQGRLRYSLVEQLLTLCAERPDEWVAKSEVDALSDKGPLQLRNELGAFSKLTKKLFGQPIWPVEWAKENGAYQYRMPSAMAELWRHGLSKEDE